MHGGTIASLGEIQIKNQKTFHEYVVDFFFGEVDLGGSLAVASRGLYATGVSTDLNGILTEPRWLTFFNLGFLLVTYLNSGGQVGDILKAIVKCDKCKSNRVSIYICHPVAL